MMTSKKMISDINTSGESSEPIKSNGKGIALVVTGTDAGSISSETIYLKFRHYDATGSYGTIKVIDSPGVYIVQEVTPNQYVTETVTGGGSLKAEWQVA